MRHPAHSSIALLPAYAALQTALIFVVNDQCNKHGFVIEKLFKNKKATGAFSLHMEESAYSQLMGTVVLFLQLYEYLAKKTNDIANI